MGFFGIEGKDGLVLTKNEQIKIKFCINEKVCEEQREAEAKRVAEEKAAEEKRIAEEKAAEE